MTTVMWFRRDLRLEDNTALYHALLEEDEVVLVFNVNPEQFIEDSKNHQAFFQAVAHFQQSIDNGRLQIFVGSPEECFTALAKKLPEWKNIYYNQDETGYGAKRDQQMQDFFAQHEIKVHKYLDHHLHGSEEIKNQQGSFYKVFTPYAKQWQQLSKPKVKQYEMPADKLVSESLFPEHEEKFAALLKELPSETLYAHGTKAGQKQLNDFLERLSDYDRYRDRPDLDWTSHLSSYLRTGELSIRMVWQSVSAQEDSTGKETFQNELCWRDFYNMIYFHYPNQKEEAIREPFRRIVWQNNQDYFEAWTKGQTGFPLVDAAIQQLLQNGWMHNRLRMIVASFLTKDLLIDWRWGEKYFQQRLIDYDPASNIGGWQWGASTGTDAAPYFRIFNPTTQSERFDPKGDFIRLYLPELKNVPDKYIHQPSKMTEEEQAKCGVVIGRDYPKPIVSHQDNRKKALAMYEESKDYQERSN